MSAGEVISWIASHVLPPLATFYAGLVGGLSQHVQKPLTEYRQTLTDISRLMLRSVLLMFEQRDKSKPASPEAKKLYDDLRDLHARLVSSSNAIPIFARARAKNARPLTLPQTNRRSRTNAHWDF